MYGMSYQILRKSGTKLKLYSTYHPHSQWPHWLNWAEYWYNTNCNSTTRVSLSKPFMAGFKILFKCSTDPSTIEEVSRLVAERDQMLDDLRMKVFWHEWKNDIS